MISEMNSIHPIEIIYIDQKTQAELGNFPIDRKYYAEIIDIIENDNPKLIFLKFFFDTKSESDQILESALLSYKNIVTQSTTLLEPSKDQINNYNNYSIPNIEIETYQYEHMLLPNPQLLKGFDGLGLVDFITEDNKYKNLRLISKVGNYYIPSIALKIGMIVNNTQTYQKEDGIYLGKSRKISDDEYLAIDLSEPNNFYKTYSFIDIINHEIQHDFENKIIIIYIEDSAVRQISSEYGVPHNNAEIVADSINTILKKL